MKQDRLGIEDFIETVCDSDSPKQITITHTRGDVEIKTTVLLTDAEISFYLNGPVTLRVKDVV